MRHLPKIKAAIISNFFLLSKLLISIKTNQKKLENFIKINAMQEKIVESNRTKI
jgi:hypothetical protein